MAKSKIFPFNFSAGTKRDNTQFDGNFYSDAKWCRWYRKKPKKMGGYQSVSDTFSGIVRGEPLMYSSSGYSYVYGGSQSQLEMVILDSSGGGGAYYDRTPTGLAVSANNEWKTTAIYNSSGTEMVAIGMVTQTLADISDKTDNKIWYGHIDTTAAFTQLGSLEVSGGVVAIAPYLFAYGNDGYLAWSDKNNIAAIGAGGGGDAGDARICANKVVKGIPIRGGSSNSPAGLFWSLDTLQRISYVGGTLIFRNDTIASNISILSTNAVVDYDGVIEWPGVDRFLSYNGVVQEVENNTHLDWFFNNYNRTCPQKIFAYKNSRYGEIWYCFPFGTATECTHALVHNVRENTWYDTELPEGGRSAALPAISTFQNPLMFGVEATSGSKYRLWMHESGVDKVVDGATLAVQSYFETPNIAFVDEGPMNDGGWMGANNWVRVIRMEPDFLQTGDLTITLKGAKFAMAPHDTEQSYTYDGTTSFKIDSRKQYREMTIKFESNVQGGDYYMGKCMIELAPGDVRATAGSVT